MIPLPNAFEATYEAVDNQGRRHQRQCTVVGATAGTSTIRLVILIQDDDGTCWATEVDSVMAIPET